MKCIVKVTKPAGRSFFACRASSTGDALVVAMERFGVAVLSAKKLEDV